MKMSYISFVVKDWAQMSMKNAAKCVILNELRVSANSYFECSIFVVCYNYLAYTLIAGWQDSLYCFII